MSDLRRSAEFFKSKYLDVCKEFDAERRHREIAQDALIEVAKTNKRMGDALEYFNNRRKLAYSLRAESPHLAAFVEAVGVGMDQILANQELNLTAK